MTRRQRHKNKNFPLIRLVPILIIIMVSLAAYFAITRIDNQLTETAIEISHTESKLAANKMIDQALNAAIAELSLASSDIFITRQAEPEAISANTLLVNQFCTLVSENITANLNRLAEVSIPVPFGQLLGISYFATSGPTINFDLLPMGGVNVDYETSFTAVGINQTNFKIWINVDMDMKVVYPLRQEPVSLSRKIMLVDTVISGTVPDQYLNFGR